MQRPTETGNRLLKISRQGFGPAFRNRTISWQPENYAGTNALFYRNLGVKNSVSHEQSSGTTAGRKQPAKGIRCMKQKDALATLVFRRTKGYLPIALLILACFPLPIVAQTAPKPKPKVIKMTPIDETAQELADEYTDILEKLHDMIADYTDYLLDIGDKALMTELSFDRFSAALGSSSYAEDPDQLETDIDAYTSKLDRLDRECSQAGAKRSAKACRVTRSLKREMSLIREQLAAHQEHLEETSYSQAQIKRAMKDAYGADRELTKQSLEVARKAMEKAAEELERIDMAVPRAPRGATPPTPPTRSYTKSKKGVVTGPAGEAGTQRSANGVLTVGSAAIPVMVSNPNGSVEITGTSGKTIDVSLDFEIAASSRAREKELADAMGLQLSSERDGYHIEVTVPQLSDPQTRILKNALVVMVPSGLRLISKSAYGEVTVVGMNGAVDATTSYSAMDISDCDGGVTARNSMGSISLTDCTGKLIIENSYGGIEIDQCNGVTSISNAYAPVTLTDSRGPTTVHNSGEVSVSGHSGTVTIFNQYGAVSVSNVRGDVDIQNAYQSVEAEDIDGRVQIENNYAPISVAGVKGRTKLINRFAGIKGEDVVGPFDIASQNGTVELSLGRSLSGPCVINSSFGSVQLEIPSSLGLVILARTSSGEIKSSYPIELTSVGLNKSGIIRVGSGRDSISIVGTNAVIEVSDGR